MFIMLLVVNLSIALIICLATAAVFRKMLAGYLRNYCSEEGSSIWVKFMSFLLCIIGITAGTRIWEVERYLVNGRTVELSREQMALEMYKTLIATLQICALMLFVFLTCAWIASLIKKKS
ncbi:MAG: hypothetical protein NDI77_12320 [Geobacteraceae bacterium]|nr:hypothetical protein [Geobacteraceae bacterium]